MSGCLSLYACVCDALLCNMSIPTIMNMFRLCAFAPLLIIHSKQMIGRFRLVFSCIYDRYTSYCTRAIMKQEPDFYEDEEIYEAADITLPNLGSTSEALSMSASKDSQTDDLSVILLSLIFIHLVCQYFVSISYQN